MRKSSAYKEKLYTNDKALCVVGNKIDLARQHSPQQRYANKSIKLSLEAPEETPSGSQQTRRQQPADKRKPLKLNVKEYKNLQVCNKQLRQIYETVEVRDFERILRSLYVSDEYRSKREKSRTEDVIAKIRPDEIYEHFYGQHYAHLRNLISKSQVDTVNSAIYQ